ncbi:integrase [Clostridia bacterium]|nr:integrase [Clostridia bacterium]
MVSTGIYLRVSTEEQVKEGYSIRAQEEKLRSYAKIKDWPIYSIYADEGISGKDIEGRPEIKRLIADVISGKVNNVLIYKIDRLTRSTKNLIELVELFNLHNCAFNSLNESIDTGSATGRMFLKIVGIFAEFERENLAERLRLGFERKAKEGYSLATYHQSFGYNREVGNKIQEIDAGEAEIVRRIFDMYLNGDYNFARIAKTLNAENIPTKMGKRWATFTIKCLLTNPTYIGKVRYSCRDASKYFEAEGRHETIIDEDTFSQVQEKIGKISRVAYTKRPTSGVYFCGVLYCPICGHKYGSKWNYKVRNGTGKTKELGYPCYRCNGLKDNGCTAKSISHAKLEQAFEEYIARIGGLSVDVIEKKDNVQKPDDSVEMAAIAVEIEQIEQKTKEIMGLFMSSSLTFEEYQSMAGVGTERKNELKARLERLERIEQTRQVRYTRAEIVNNVRDNWKALDDGQRQQFVQKFIKKIVVHSEPPKEGRRNDVIIDEIVFNEF